MSYFNINVADALNGSSEMKSVANKLAGVSERLNGLNVKNSISIFASSAQNNGRNIESAANKVAASTLKVVRLSGELQEIANIYQTAENKIIQKPEIDIDIGALLGIGSETAMEINYDWKWDKLFWKGVGQIGVVGKVVSGLRDFSSSGVSWKSICKGTKDLLSVVGDVAKEASKDNPDFKELLFGNWKKGGILEGLSGITTASSKGAIFCASLSKQLSGYSFKNASTVGDKIKVGTKWTGTMLSFAGNAIDNYEEFGTVNSGRFWAESVTETAVDVGLGMLATAGTTVLLGASAPAVVVCGVAVGVNWLADRVSEAVTGKEFTELVSDTILDFGEKVVDVGGKVVQGITDTVSGWGESICAGWKKVFG